MLRQAAHSQPALRTFRHTNSWEEHTLTRWLYSKEKKLQLRQVVPTSSRLEALFHVLPTRKRNDFNTDEKLSRDAPKFGDPIYPGHYLVMLPFYPNSRRRPDGTPAIHAPPVPWTRRQWIGGKIRFAPQPLLVGLGFVQKKVNLTKKYAHAGLLMQDDDHSLDYEPPEYGTRELLPTVRVHHQFVTMQWYPQNLDLIMEDRETEYFTERYDRLQVKTSNLVPPQSGILSFTFHASSSLLSAFCFINQETHRIHIDLDYANKEGYPNLVIPVELQLMSILDTLGADIPKGLSIKEIEYQVVNPLFAEREISIYRHSVHDSGMSRTSRQSYDYDLSKYECGNTRKSSILLWTTDERGIVGVVAKVLLRPLVKPVSDRPWKMDVDKGCLVYRRDPVVDELKLQSSEEDDKRILAKTLTF